MTADAIEPATPEECARALADAARDRRSVRVTGGGTKSYLGDGEGASLVLLTRALAGVIDHVPADLTITVGGGTRVTDLSASLAAEDQFLPLDPPHAEGATLGGVIAANSNGFWRARYGGVRDLLIGTRVALPDGTVARGGGRVVKNVAGYDLNKLLTGSLGTLGVIVEATFKVLPRPAASDGLKAAFASAADAFATADHVIRAPARPESCVLHREDEGGWTMLVRASGTAPTVSRAIADARREASARGAEVRQLGDEIDVLRELPARAADGALVRVAVPLAAQLAFAGSVGRLRSRSTIAADAASGVVRVHLQGDDDAVISDAEALLMAARAVGGSGRIERRTERLRDRLATWPTRPNGDFVMRRLKEAFDPAGILEPGRSAIG